jgi:anti-sigma factor RsiW
MNIDRHNYEEFFILYLDNELSADERSRVEDFAAANPDLKEELDMLLQSKLVPDTDIIFNRKEELLKHADGIGSHNYTEWLLLYTDNELDTAQKASLEQWIVQNPTAQQELSLLQKARLQADESIVFPDKQLLYRTEERRVVAIRWWRMAAAAVLLLGVSSAAFMFNQKRKADSIASAGNTAATGPVAQVVPPAGKDSHAVAPMYMQPEISPQPHCLPKIITPAKQNSLMLSLLTLQQSQQQQ